MFVLVYYIIILYFSLFLSSKGMGNAGYAVIAVGSILLFLGYYIQERVYLNILNEKCDPIRFLKLMNKKIENYKWIKSLRIPYEFNCAVSYMSLGRYQEAKSCIQECGISGLNLNRRYSITYNIDLIICHYELDELEQAEELYHANIEKLTSNKRNKCMSTNIDIFLGMRYFYLGTYEESYEQLKQIAERKICTRHYLEISFYLAKMDIRNNQLEQATKRFSEIAEKGNTLWIAHEAKRLIR